MKPLALIFYIYSVTVFFPSSAFALEDSLANRAEQADRYLSVNSPQAIFKDIADRTREFIPEAEQQPFIDMLTKHLNMEILSEAMKRAMMEHFTADELSALADFYSHPSAKSAMNKMGGYMADVIPIVQDEMIKAQQKAMSSTTKPPQGAEDK